MVVALIAKRELLESTRRGSLLWAGAMILVLLGLALAIGWQQQKQVHLEREAGARASYENWLNQGEKNPHIAQHYTTYVFKPVAPLAFIEPGIEDYVGSAVRLERRDQHLVRFRPAQDDATELQRFGSLSPSWILLVFVPLLVIALTFNSFSGEREQGTLRQTLSIGIRPGQLIAGKFIAVIINVALLIAVPAVIAALLMAAFPGRMPFAADDVLRISLIFSGYLLYLGIFILIGFAVSAAMTSSRMALLLLLVVWIVVCIAVPRMVSDLSLTLYPTPSAFEFGKELGEGKSAVSRQAFETLGASSYWDVQPEKYGDLLQATGEAMDEASDRHFALLWKVYDRQQGLQTIAGVLAPLLAMQAFSMSMAGTDLYHHRDFLAAADRHRRYLHDLMYQDQIRSAGDRTLNYRAGRELWEKLPPFSYHMPAVSWSLAHSWPSLLVIAFVFLLSLLATMLFVKNMRGGANG